MLQTPLVRSRLPACGDCYDNCMQCLLVIALLVSAQLLSAADIVLTQGWSRATSASMPNGAVFVTIVNNGSADDHLVSVSTDAAERVELHSVVTDGTTKRMVPVESISVAAMSAIKLQPGSFHIMLFGLRQPLVESKSIALTLNFSHAGALPLAVTIGGPAAMNSPDAPAATPSCCLPQ